MCEAYVIPFLFGSFFTVCHPYIDVHFLKCFFCYFHYWFYDKPPFFMSNDVHLNSLKTICSYNCESAQRVALESCMHEISHLESP